MGSVVLLHYNDRINPNRPARHYLEYTARTVYARVCDQKSGSRWRSAPICYAAFERDIDFVVARVWPNTDRRDEKRLRDLHNNPRLCPICNPRLQLVTKQYSRITTDDATGETHISYYWRTFGNPNAYGALHTIRNRQPRPARKRIRRDGTKNYRDAAYDDACATYIDDPASDPTNDDPFAGMSQAEIDAADAKAKAEAAKLLHVADLTLSGETPVHYDAFGTAYVIVNGERFDIGGDDDYDYAADVENDYDPNDNDYTADDLAFDAERERGITRWRR